MAVKFLTQIEVKQAFANALPAGGRYDPERWAKLERALLDPKWESAGEGIQVLQVDGARLFRVRWDFPIDKTNTSLDSMMHRSAGELRQRLEALINGEPVAYAASPENDVKDAGGVIVSCWTHGIIG